MQQHMITHYPFPSARIRGHYPFPSARTRGHYPFIKCPYSGAPQSRIHILSNSGFVVGVCHVRHPLTGCLEAFRLNRTYALPGTDVLLQRGEEKRRVVSAPATGHL